MKIKKIDIQTSNKKYATDIAMLMDKKEFLDAIKQLRNKWNIIDLPLPHNLHSYLELHIFKDTGLSGTDDVKKRIHTFEDDIDEILRKFKRDRTFKNAVKYALITGLVPNEIYKRCYFDTVTIGQEEDLNHLERYQYVIVLSPRTEKIELEEAFAEFQKHLKGSTPKNEYEKVNPGKIAFQNLEDLSGDVPEHRELIDQYIKGSIYNSADTDKYKTLKELHRTREWYWIKYQEFYNDGNKKPFTHNRVLDIWQENNCPVKKEHMTDREAKKCKYCSIEDVDIVDHALADYEKLLMQS